MTDPGAFGPMVRDYADQVQPRLEQLATMAADGGLDDAVALLTDAVQAGGVLQAFGTGHSEAFAMEIAGRAGGLIPTNKIALRDLVLRGGLPLDALGGSSLERDADVVDQLWSVSPIHPGDVFLIASNSGVNGSIVGLAIRAKAEGHPVIAVTSLQHTMQVQPKHPSGQRLCDVADVVIDNLAPVRGRHPGPDRRRAGRRRLLDHQRLHRPAAHDGGRRTDPGQWPGPTPLPVRQHPGRGRAQPRPRSRVRGPDHPRHLSRRTRHTPQPDLTTLRTWRNTHEHHQEPTPAARLSPRLSRGRGAAPRQRLPGVLRDVGDRGTPGASSAPAGNTSETNPFGMASNAAVDAVIFNGGYGIAYAEFAGKQLEALQAGSKAKVTAATNIAQTLQPRFVAGNPPDVIDNSGAGIIGINTIRDQLSDLTDVLEAKNYEGQVIKDTLYPGVTVAGDLRRQVRRAELRVDGLCPLVLRRALREGGLGGAQDLRRDARPGREGQGEGQVPARLGQGSRHLLPDDGRLLGDQAGGRRGSPGPGEPEAGLLVPASRSRTC